VTLLDAIHAEIVDAFGEDYRDVMVTGYAVVAQFEACGVRPGTDTPIELLITTALHRQWRKAM
jgi:hypothetical protein